MTSLCYFLSSFKERGARYTLIMLSPEQKQRGVIAASAGNHALALAYHGSSLNIPVTVVMPIVAPLMKVQLCGQYGANVIIKGGDIIESRSHAMKISKQEGKMYINGYDHPHILAGQGTVGLEICEQVPDMDAAVIPVGGGGLIAGMALAIKNLYPKVHIIVSFFFLFQLFKYKYLKVILICLCYSKIILGIIFNVILR